MKDYKKLIRKILTEVVESEKFDAALIAKYYHQNYRQIVNGITYDYQKFAKHIHDLKSTLSDVKLTFSHIIAEGNAVCTVHYSEGTRENGNRVKAKVIAYFEFSNDQLISCEEMAQIIQDG